jgi:hypothetical protein
VRAHLSIRLKSAGLSASREQRLSPMSRLAIVLIVALTVAANRKPPRAG